MLCATWKEAWSHVQECITTHLKGEWPGASHLLASLPGTEHILTWTWQSFGNQVSALIFSASQWQGKINLSFPAGAQPCLDSTRGHNSVGVRL